MAKLSILLDTRNKKSTLFPIVIRVSHRSKWKYLQTGFRVPLSQWNDAKKQIKKPFPNLVRANAKIMKKYAIASEVLSEHTAVLKKLQMIEIYNLIYERIEEEDNGLIGSANTLTKTAKRTYLMDYAKKVASHTRKVSTDKYADSIESAAKYLLKFHRNDQLLITDIDAMFLRNLEGYYAVNSQTGDSLNGLGEKLRAIRKVINVSIADKTTEVTPEHYPFGKRGYSIKTSSTKKRAIKLSEIEKIKDLKVDQESKLWHHRNYFLFYFYMRGMNFVDLANLKMTNLEDDRLIYKRQKTKRSQSSKEFNIKINEEAKNILKYYTIGKALNDFIFPVLDLSVNITNSKELLRNYESARAKHNRRLKELAKIADIKTNLTTYVARHSFATAALRNGVSKAEIGDMLGHANYHVTETYLAGFEQKTLDDAADKAFNFSPTEK